MVYLETVAFRVIVSVVLLQSAVTREPVAGGSRFTRFFNSNNVEATTSNAVEPATLNGGSRRSVDHCSGLQLLDGVRCCRLKLNYPFPASLKLTLSELISPPKSPSPDVHHAARSGASPIDPLAAAVQLQYRSQQQQQLNMHLSHADSQQPAVSQSGLPRHQRKFSVLSSMQSIVASSRDARFLSADAGEVEAALKSLLLPKAAPSRPAAGE